LLQTALVELGVRDGVAVIPGNHDYYAGADRVLATVQAAGADVLRNRGRVLGDAGGAFALLGVDDVWAARDGLSEGPNLARALADLPEGDLARVLLCHNPEFYPEAADHVDLQLSGHTHGGQVNFLVRPADYVLRHGFIQGHYHRGASQLYVNRGFGTAGPPARVGAPPEVSRIVLTSV
jgi:predicted MPP superfamily phosphohydrolase